MSNDYYHNPMKPPNFWEGCLLLFMMVISAIFFRQKKK